MKGIGEGDLKKKKGAVAVEVEVGVMMKRDGDMGEHVFWFMG